MNEQRILAEEQVAEYAAGKPYPLEYPIRRTLNAGKADERVEEIAELTLRRIKGKHLKAFSKAASDMEGVLILIAGSAGLLAAEADELDAADIMPLGEIVENFMPSGLRTGAMPSET